MRCSLPAPAARRVCHISCGVILGAVTLTGCASFTLPAPRLTPAQCTTEPALVGTWTDTRLTQLGPAWEKISFSADCSFDQRAQLLFFRFTESGQYRVENGRIQFERQGGRRYVPYRFDDDTLVLTDAPGEELTYRRSGG